MAVSSAPRPIATSSTLVRYEKLRTATGDRLRELIALVAQVMGLANAVVGLMDRQGGLFRTFLGTVPEIAPRLSGILSYVVFRDAPVMVPDARTIPELSADAAVRQGLVRGFAGIPLHDEEGMLIGVLVLIDPEPLSIQGDRARLIGPFAAQIEAQLAFTRKLEDLHQSFLRQQGSLQMLRGILRATTSFAILATNVDGVITMVNAGAERMLQIYTPSALGKLSIVAFIEAETHATLHASRFRSMVAALSESAPVEVERVVSRSDRSTFPAAVVIHPAADEDGAITGYVIAARDLTEAQAAARTKDDFVAAISHELRTPLTSILGSLGILAAGLGGELPPEGTELIQLARSNGMRLLRLLGNLLDFQAITTGSARGPREICTLGQVVRHAIEIARPAGDGTLPDIMVEPGGMDALVSVEQGTLARALANLLDNALRFSPPGKPAVVAAVEHGGRVRIVVTDRGPGVPESFRPHLFSSFAQAEAGDTRTTGGTGIGLSMTRTIAERHGGSVGFEPARGGGSSFYLELPRVTTRPPA